MLRIAGAVLFSLALALAPGSASEETPPDPERLKALVGQLILLEFKIDADRYRDDKGGDHGVAIADMVVLANAYGLGGFVLDSHNDALFLDPDLAAVKAATGVDGLRPFVAVNEEGGVVQIPAEWWWDHKAEWIGCTSLGPIPGFKATDPTPSEGWACPDHTWSEDRHYMPFLRNAHLMAARWTVAETEAHAADIGRALADLNVTLNLAPVLGVSDGTKAASFLGDRTFSNDPATVAAWASAFSRGLRRGSAGRVGTVVKHFPGLGSVKGNTDDGLAETPPLADLKQRDLKPYERSIVGDYQALGVMMSNAAVPGLTCPDTGNDCRTPATLSRAAYSLLRDAYGWHGLVVTDTLKTKAVVSADRSLPEAAVAAFAAGADMVMVKPEAETSTMADYESLLSEVSRRMLAWVNADRAARIPRLLQSVERIRQAKSGLVPAE